MCRKYVGKALVLDEALLLELSHFLLYMINICVVKRSMNTVTLIDIDMKLTNSETFQLI